MNKLMNCFKIKNINEKSKEINTLNGTINNLFNKKITNLCKTDISFTYYENIMKKLKSKETNNFIIKKPKYRRIIINWFVELQIMFNIDKEILFSAIHIFDKFSNIEEVNNNIIQLVAITSILITSKLHQIDPIMIEELIYISDNQYKVKEIENMEKLICQKLEWDIILTTPFDFITVWFKLIFEMENHDIIMQKKIIYFAKYFIQVYSLNETYTEMIPSQLVAKSIYLCSIYFPEFKLNRLLFKKITGYNFSKNEIQILHILVQNNLKMKDGTNVYKLYNRLYKLQIIYKNKL